MKNQIQMKCEEHPKYKAVYPPKGECLICWKIYATKLQLKLKALQSK